jgi:hypothetical protein
MQKASDECFVLSAKNRHRLEAYAPLAFRTVERPPGAIPTVSPCNTPTLQHSITPLLHRPVLVRSFAGSVLYPSLQHLQVLR